MDTIRLGRNRLPKDISEQYAHSFICSGCYSMRNDSPIYICLGCRRLPNIKNEFLINFCSECKAKLDNKSG